MMGPSLVPLVCRFATGQGVCVAGRRAAAASIAHRKTWSDNMLQDIVMLVRSLLPGSAGFLWPQKGGLER